MASRTTMRTSEATSFKAASWRSTMRTPATTRDALSAPPMRVARPPARIAAEISRPSIMSEARIGRVLVASLHQAIADLLPTRLEFYENWLNGTGLREWTIGLAPLTAVLSFLRTEGEAYNLITARAGEYAAAWTSENVSPLERRLIPALPAGLRARAALRIARQLIRQPYTGSRALSKIRRGVAMIDLRGSLFCQVRETSVNPLCTFYASAIGHVLKLFDVTADARVTECRATGGQRGCVLSVSLNGRADRTAVAA